MTDTTTMATIEYKTYLTVGGVRAYVFVTHDFLTPGDGILVITKMPLLDMVCDFYSEGAVDYRGHSIQDLLELVADDEGAMGALIGIMSYIDDLAP